MQSTVRLVEMPQARLEWLDALRGIAAFSVVIYHARAILWIGLGEVWKKHGTHPDLSAALGYLTAPFSFGYLGVILFFVVSGFSIHLRGARDLAAQGLATRLPLREFFLRRFFRLYPTYCAALLLTACIDFYLVARLPGLVGGEDHRPSTFLATLFGLQGIVSPYFGSASVFWTLVLEMHLYLAYPLLFHFSRRRGPELVLAATLLVSVATLLLFRFFHVPDRWPFWHAGGPVFLKYWFTWTIGFYVAELVTGRARFAGWFSWPVSLTALVAAVALTTLRLPDVAEIPFAVCFGWLVLAASRRASLQGLNWLLQPAALIGIISYSLYSIHIPLLRLTRVFVNSGMASESVQPLLLGALVALGGAVGLYFLTERWSIARSRSVARNQEMAK